MPGKLPKRKTIIRYIDEEGNRQTYTGDPRFFKQPKTTRGPEIKKPTKKITAYKGGGMAGMRRFNRGGKV